MAGPALVDTVVQIEIPEDVRLRFRLAGPGTRGLAYLVDLVFRAGIFWGTVVAVAAAFPLTQLAGISWGILLMVLFTLEWGYGWFFEALWNGQTPGKRLLGIRVVREDGHPVGFYDALVRNLLRAADILPLFYAVGLVTMAITGRLQRLGDLLAGTMVVHERRERLRRETVDLEGATRLAPDELASAWRPAERTLDLIHAFALRRDQLEPARAREIARLLAEPLARRLSYRGEDLRRPDLFLLRLYRTFQVRP
jgi:uncharacterized RDD family membrane protein YckC